MGVAVPQPFANQTMNSESHHRSRNPRKPKHSSGPRHISRPNNKPPMNTMSPVKHTKAEAEGEAEAEAKTSETLYAGYSLLTLVPSPSSVPLPAFITKNIARATNDLRNMSLLDFS
ncbi:hypothetical protein Fmac_000677 [Flemingia macrophylla]|uniref:Uncharacterized protein n=1 Tax=Flemingia macrophylla TaxID=520843 RepID=A0ABD1NEW6_9FABA